MKKIVVYDFDKTLTYKDTLFGFFKFATQKNILYPYKISTYVLYMILTKFNFTTNSKLKDIGIKLFLMNLDKNSLKEKFRSYHTSVEFNQIYQKLTFENEVEYFIISASFEEYIKPMFPECITVLGSRIRYENGQAIALEFNCYKEDKVKALKEFNLDKIDVLYTDSYSDSSLAKISEQIIIVTKDEQKVCNNFEEFRRYFKK